MLNSSCYMGETSCKEELKWNAELCMSTEVFQTEHRVQWL